MIPYRSAHPGRRLEWLALVLILLLAAALRMGEPGITEFKRDEANLSFMALDMARGHSFPLLGIDSSVGIRNAPFSVYVIVPPFLLTSDPTLATLYIGLLGVFAVLLVYLLARRYYGPLAAFVAGLLYAVSPWAVIFSRKIWAQDFLPVFVALTVGSGLLGFVEGKRWAQFLHLPLLVTAGQIHYGAFVLVPLTLYLLVIGRRRLARQFIFGVGLAILLVIPYGIGIDQAGLLQPDTIKKALSGSPAAWQAAGQEKPQGLELSGAAIHDAALIIGGTDISSLTGGDAYPAFLASVPGVYSVVNVVPWLVLLAAIWLIARLVRKRDPRTPVDGLLLLWLLFTPLIFTIKWTPMYTHYLIPMIPAAYFVLGVGVQDLWCAFAARPAWRTGRYLGLTLGAAALASLIILQVWFFTTLLRFVDTHDTTDGFGTPLHYLLAPRAAILSQRPQHVLANLDGQYIGYHEETTVWNFLLYDVPTVRFLDDKTDVYPAETALYLSHQCTSPGQYFSLLSSCLSIATRAPGDFDDSAYQPVPDAGQLHFANGLSIQRYRWDSCLTLVWTTGGLLRDDYSFAIHFTDAEHKTVAFGDGLSWRGVYWRPGDRVVRRFCATRGQENAAAITAVEIGMYTTPDNVQFYGVDLLDAQDKPSGQYITIPLNAPDGQTVSH